MSDKPDIQGFDVTTVQETTGQVYSIPPPPPLPITGLGGDGNGEVRVDTELLQRFATYVQELEAPLRHAQAQLREMDPRPGGFHQAYELRTQLGGDDASGLRGSFSQVIDRTIETLTDIRAGVQRLAADYETTEEFNEVEAQALLDAMPDLAADITAIQQVLAQPQV